MKSPARALALAAVFGLFATNPVFADSAKTSDPALAAYLGRQIERASVDGAVGGAVALATRPDYVGLLPSIVMPTLIIVGIEDTLTPVALSEQLKMGIPNSTLAVSRAGSHAVIIEDADRANRAVAMGEGYGLARLVVGCKRTHRSAGGRRCPAGL